MKETSLVFAQGTEVVAGHQMHALDEQLPPVLADEAVAADMIGNQLQRSESEAGNWNSKAGFVEKVGGQVPA